MTIIRRGNKRDLPEVLELIKELAEYEHSLDQVNNSIEQMEIDGFGANPVYGLIVAEENQSVIGTSIFYYRYSTWKGKRLYLEDIVVTESKRGTGVGTLLFDETIKIAKETSCTGMMWQVLDWNSPAINFYKKYGTTMEDNWNNCHLDF